MDNSKFELLYMTKKKSMGITYLLWLTVGILGVHRLYIWSDSSVKMAAFEFSLAVLFILLLGNSAGVSLVIGVIIVAVWVVDLFCIPGAVAKANLAIRIELEEGNRE